MKRILVFLCLVFCATFGKETAKSFYVTQKITSDSEPAKSEHVFNEKVINLWFQFSTKRKIELIKSNESEVSPFKEKYKMDSKSTNKNSTRKEYVLTFTEKTARNRTGDPALAESNVIPTYDMGPEFNTDDEDIRSDSRNYYYSWPYYYHTPYEYDKIKYDIEVQKAKDKRFIESKIEKIIPVHEEINDIPNSYVYTGPDYAYSTYNTYNSDNPIYGNKPFFSYVLGDYFDKSYDDDSLTFKDTSWGKEFDKESLYHNIDDYDKQTKYLQDKYPNHFEEKFVDTSSHSKPGRDHQQNEIESKNYDNKNQFDAINRRSDYIQGYENAKKLYGNYLKEFKEFTDSFANKFGSEDHIKFSDYSVKDNADKGQKKRGLQDVFYKDQYQEQSESFDDVKKNSDSEKHGLRTKATASLGLEGNLNNENDFKNILFEKNYQEAKLLSNINGDLRLYKDMAKNVALSNYNKFNHK